MPASDHDSAKDEFAERMPAATEGICSIWHPDTDAHGAVCGHDLEDDIEDGVRDGVALEVGSLGDGDE